MREAMNRLAEGTSARGGDIQGVKSYRRLKD